MTAPVFMLKTLERLMPNHNADETTYIALFASIDAKSIEELTHVIFNKIPEDTRTLYFLICSEGGSVSHGFALYNLLRALPYRIVMHNIGNVDSIANVIFMAGHERYGVKNACFLIHRVKSKVHDDHAQLGSIKEKLSCIETDEARIRDAYLQHTKIPEAELDSFMDAGQVKDASYALRTGMIDAIRDIALVEKPNLIAIQCSPAK